MRSGPIRGRRAALLALGAMLAGEARGQAVVVKDELCGLFDARGEFVFNVFGLSTLAPNGMLHLVCHTRVAAPGVPVRFRPRNDDDVCGIEGNFTSTWEERISPSGQAVLECWVNAGRESRSDDSADAERMELDGHAEDLDE